MLSPAWFLPLLCASGLRFVLAGGVLPVRDSQRLLEPADGVHAELHGEPHSWRPVRLWHQARQHLQPGGHRGAVHGAVQQDPQAAAGACSRNQMKGHERTPWGSVQSDRILFPACHVDQEALQKAALEPTQGFLFVFFFPSKSLCPVSRQRF